MNNKTNKIPWYSVRRVTASFVGAHKQKHAISEPGPRACTVKLLRCAVMPLILSAWVKSEERGWTNRGWVGLCGSGGCEDAGACGDHASPPLPSLNVKCLTGRLSEEELQRAVAPLEPGGGRRGAEALAPRLSFCQCPHASITLSFCNAITGRVLHRESNDLTVLLSGYSIVIIHLRHMLFLHFSFTDMLSLKHYREWAGNKHRSSTDPPNSLVSQMIGCLHLF